MRVKIFLLFVVLLGCASSKVTSNSILHPKKGVISFERKSSITNSDSLKRSIKSFEDKFAKALKKQVIKERQESGEYIDTFLLDQMVAMAKANFKPMLLDKMINTKAGKKSYKFKDSIIISSASSNGIARDYEVINREKSTFYILSKKDSTTVYKKNTPYYYKNSDNIQVQEFNNDIKIINGFKCFKIVVTIPENMENSDDEYVKLFKDAKTTYEMYVTTKFNCKYHPYFHYKSVLEKYFPLEIIETTNGIKGLETRYTLVDFNVK